eukprot:TRINITY_DN7219_c0_g3_i3.p1 TRINITY_DN7219_c0_g3~~TRINITY_DN7219_c0_g3_i3.p1  ORF type:complete len:208 (-),score=107.58 TRINITY_DN7219_c0_g3_i3:479-1057(-)
MLRSLVGSEMCIRDSINAEYGSSESSMSVNVSKYTACLVSGETWKHKDVIKAVGGARWDKELKGWLLPEGKQQEVLDALKKAKVEVTEEEPPEKPKAEASVDANAHLTIEPYKKSVLLKGDTKDVKEQLKAFGGSWIKTLGGWCFRAQDKEGVVKLLREDPTNTVEEVEGTTVPVAKKRKKAHDDFIEEDDY